MINKLSNGRAIMLWPLLLCLSFMLVSVECFGQLKGTYSTGRKPSYEVETFIFSSDTTFRYRFSSDYGIKEGKGYYNKKKHSIVFHFVNKSIPQLSTYQVKTIAQRRDSLIIKFLVTDTEGHFPFLCDVSVKTRQIEAHLLPDSIDRLAFAFPALSDSAIISINCLGSRLKLLIPPAGEYDVQARIISSFVRPFSDGVSLKYGCRLRSGRLILKKDEHRQVFYKRPDNIETN